MLATMTPIVREGELSFISFKIENICESQLLLKPTIISLGLDVTHVLMAGVSKDHNWEAAQCLNRTSPMDDTNRPSIVHRIPLDEMCHNKDDQIADGDECDNTRVFEGFQAAKE